MHLLRTRSFLLLFLGTAVNGIGSWAALIAMWGYAAYRFDSGPGEIALIALSWAVPSAIVGPFAGVPIDRFGPKRILVVAYIGGIATALALAATTSFAQLLVLGTGMGLVKAFTYPAFDALPPRLVADDDLLAANSLLGAAVESAIIFGPLVAAGAIAVAGLRGAFAVDALTYVVGIAVVAPLPLAAIPSRPRTPLRAEVAEGLRIVRHSPPLRFILGLSTVVYLTWATFVVVEPLYVRDVLERPASFFALLQTAFGIGLVGTGLLLPRLGERVTGERALAASVVLSGVTAGVYVGTRIPAVAVLGVFLWGVDVGFFSAPSRTLLQRHSPVAAHGRVMALNRTLHSAADVIALPLAGAAAGVIGLQTTALVMAALALVSGLGGLRRAAARPIAAMTPA